MKLTTSIAQPVQPKKYGLSESNVNDLISWLRGGQVNRAVIALEHLNPAELAQPEHEPVNWSVYNGGAEVAGGLTFSEAWEYMTPERLDRQWCMVCVIDRANMPAPLLEKST